MFVIMFFGMAIFVSFANLETTGKNNKPYLKLYNGTVQNYLKNITNRPNFYTWTMHNPCGKTSFPSGRFLSLWVLEQSLQTAYLEPFQHPKGNSFATQNSFGQDTGKRGKEEPGEYNNISTDLPGSCYPLLFLSPEYDISNSFHACSFTLPNHTI